MVKISFCCCIGITVHQLIFILSTIEGRVGFLHDFTTLQPCQNILRKYKAGSSVKDDVMNILEKINGMTVNINLKSVKTVIE